MNTAIATDLRNSRRFGSVCLGLLVLSLSMATIAPAAEDAPVVKVYSCPAGQATATAEKLRNDFAVFPGVRIAADERTSQVITQASPEIQAKISQSLAALAATPSTAGSSASVVKTTAESGQSRSVALRNVKADQLEASLWSTLGSRLFAVPSARPQTKRYRLASASGGNVDLTIDPAAGQVLIEGSPAAIEACARLVEVLDRRGDAGERDVRLMPLRTTQSSGVQKAAEMIQTATAASGTTSKAGTFQRTEAATGLAKGTEVAQAAPRSTTPGTAAPARPGTPADGKAVSGLLSPVQIEMLEGLDVLVLRGNREDVDQVMAIINQIERLSAETEPSIELLQLRNVDSLATASLVQSLYDQVYLPRQGSVSMTALVKPNAILVVGRPENVRTAADLIGRLDQPVAPDTQFQYFLLKHASAATAATTIQQFYPDRAGQGLAPAVRVIPDVRSNALVIQAGPRDMAEVAALIERIDTSTSEAVNEVRIIQLEHSMAADIAAVLREAIGTGARVGQAGQAGQFGQPGQPGQQGQPGAAAAQGQQRSAMLRLLTVDARERKLLNSGILSDVRITVDTRANAIVVSAPPENLELIEALIHQLDQLPPAEAQLKVFTVVNGDATSLATTLQQLFGGTTAGAGGFGAGMGGALGQGAMMAQSGAVSGETPLVSLRFAIDTRTNSVIVSGSAAELTVVEAVITRLDEGIRNRQTVVVRLKNSPATAVADAINTFLTSERQVQMYAPGGTSAFEQIEREVVVVPEMVTNSLVLSATPRFYEEVKGIIEQLDARPPMVMIQVMIAQVDLGDTNEFGIELGLQDAVLFDRSAVSSGGDLNPGYNFNSTGGLGNSVNGITNAGGVGPQGLTNFSVGRSNSSLGFGGLVLSASSENVSLLLRALAEKHRVEILQKPAIMTLDNQPAEILVGQRVPRVTEVSITSFGQNNITSMEPVGLQVGVTPRISPDGLVVMAIQATKSRLEPEATGVPISVVNGQVIRSPIEDVIYAQTTVSAMDHQTIVLGGLILREKDEFHRKVPLLGDIPVFGRLFRYDGTANTRSELLIIMTPHIVRNEADADAIRRAEAARMSWCLCDVTSIYGEAGLRKRTDEWSNGETQVIYPDMGSGPMPPSPESLPTPTAVPQTNAPMPPPLLQPAQPHQGNGARKPTLDRKVDVKIGESQQAEQASYMGAADPAAQSAVYQQPATQPQVQAPGNFYR